MTYVCDPGSIQIDVPVNPVCPYDRPTGNNSPRLPESGESMSHPKPRRIGCGRGDCGVGNFSTVHGLKILSPRVSIIWENFASSSPVEKKTPGPAPPPI